MLLSRAAVIWQSDGFAKLQRLCHTLFFCHLFFVHPFFVSYLVVFFGGFPLKDDGAVQVLAALRGQPDALLGQHRGNARVHGLRRFQAGILADVPAHDLTGRAAHHEYIAFFVSYLVLFLGYISCFSHFSLVVSTRNSIFAEKMCFKQHINLMNKHILYT